MKYNVSLGMGHTTNSSSCIHFIPRGVLEDPAVKAFIQAYEIEGWVTKEPWYRSECGSILMTAEQQESFRKALDRGSDSGVSFKPDPNCFVVVYGDEYGGIEQVFSRLCRDVAEAMNLDIYSHDYN